MADNVPQSRPSEGNVSMQNLLRGFLIGLDLLATSFVIARVVCRTTLVKARLWWDDVFIILANIAILTGLGINLARIYYGFGRHEYYLTSWEMMYYSTWTYVEWVQNFFALMCTKVSICLFLIRIPIHKRYVIPLQAAVVVLIVSNFVLEFLWIFQIWPIQALWDTRVQVERNFTRRMKLDIIFAQAIISIVSDFALALYPIVIISHVQLRLKDKIGLCFLMGLGVITGSCCIVRTVLNDASLAQDATFGGITNWFWRLFEIQLGIVCACIPTLIPAYKYFKHRLSHYYTSHHPSSSPKTPPSPLLAHHSGPHKRREGDITLLLHSAQQNHSAPYTSYPGGETVTTDTEMGGRRDFPYPAHLIGGEKDAEEGKERERERTRPTTANGGITKTWELAIEHEENAAYADHLRHREGERGGHEYEGGEEGEKLDRGKEGEGEGESKLSLDLRPSFESHRGRFREVMHDA